MCVAVGARPAAAPVGIDDSRAIMGGEATDGSVSSGKLRRPIVERPRFARVFDAGKARKRGRSVLMLVWHSLETTCPMCLQRLRVRDVGGGFALGQDTDLLIRMKGKHLIQAQIHTCLRCGYSGLADDFTDRHISKSVERAFFEKIAKHIRSQASSPARPGCAQTPLPHVQYHWAALAAEALNLAPGEIALRFLRAYWCLRLPPSIDLDEQTLAPMRKTYLREAISRFRQGLRRERNRVVVYLIGELCRRNGNFGLAAQYFERYIYRERGPRYLKLAAQKLLCAARAADAGEKTMEEVLYDQPQDSHRTDRGD